MGMELGISVYVWMESEVQNLILPPVWNYTETMLMVMLLEPFHSPVVSHFTPTLWRSKFTDYLTLLNIYKPLTLGSSMVPFIFFFFMAFSKTMLISTQAFPWCPPLPHRKQCWNLTVLCFGCRGPWGHLQHKACPEPDRKQNSVTDVSCLPKLAWVRLGEMAALGQPCNPVLSFICLNQFFCKAVFILPDEHDKSVMSMDMPCIVEVV